MNKLFSSPLTDFQITCIMVALDKDKSGTLSYKEFLDGFKVCHVYHTAKHTNTVQQVILLFTCSRTKHNTSIALRISRSFTAITCAVKMCGLNAQHNSNIMSMCMCSAHVVHSMPRQLLTFAVLASIMFACYTAQILDTKTGISSSVM
jgi:hypothetical protein